MPRYEFSDGKSHKFWQVDVDGTEVTVTYGRIGTAGQTGTKSYPDAAKAQKEADSAAAGKMKKGYALVEEAADDGKNERLVLADQLMESGDPRGQLIQLQSGLDKVSGKDRSKLQGEINKLLDANAEDLLGPHADADNRKNVRECAWQLGYWDRLYLISDADSDGEVPMAPLLEAYLSHPSAKHLSRLHLGVPENCWDGETDWSEMVAVIGKVGSESLRDLEVSDLDENTEISWCQLGDFSTVWKACPNLQKLVLRGGQLDLGKVDAPNLERLVIVSGGLDSDAVEQVAAGNLPKLTHLEIYLGTSDYGGTDNVTTVAGVLAGKNLPAVRYLGLKNSEIQGQVALAACTAAILPQLEVLDLSLGTMLDADIEPLITHAARFKHLKALDVTGNDLTSEGGKKLQKAIPCAVVHSQRDAYEDGDGEPWVYTSIAE